MTAACTTFDQIESRTATSVALAIYARRVRDGIVAVSLGKPLLKVLNFRLVQLKLPLRHGALDSFSTGQLTEFAGLLRNLNICLLRLAEDTDVQSHSLLRSDIETVKEHVEDFESILESIYLALDPEFHKAVSSAIDKLNIGVEERAALLR